MTTPLSDEDTMNIEDFRNENGTYNGVRAMASLTGLAEQSVVDIAAQVKENHRKLAACLDHAFEPAKGPFQRRRMCTRCGGEADSLAVGWYELGRRHEGMARGDA